MIVASFQSFDEINAWSEIFEQPCAVLTARTSAEVLPLLQRAEAEALNGKWAAVMLAYESARAFDPAIQTHSSSPVPLAWAAIFDAPARILSTTRGRYKNTNWEPRLSRESYSDAIESIREFIRCGDTYQVNYTFPMTCSFTGDARSWYQDLGSAQGARYCAYLDIGRYKVLSLSPELFFQRTGQKLVVRPMKGTMPRGRWTVEDDEQAMRLASCEKNRAENVMIVDLLRSDLGRISEFGSVEVTSLFEVERYNTVLQMTSTIESKCNAGVNLESIMKALFPCGSITGAPKIRTTEIIRQVEPYPRGVYTGAIGLIRPDGDCLFNVAIRTITVDTHTSEATFGVGGGITYDSGADSEYEECLLKSNFLTARGEEFELIETILLEEGKFFLLGRHIERLKSSARYFGFRCDENSVRSAFEQVHRDYGSGLWKVRLLLAKNGTTSTEVSRLESAKKAPVEVALAENPISRSNPFLFHKTTNRTVYNSAVSEAGTGKDVIFWNEQGEVTESSIANLVIVSG
ncbi:MAG TPA: aminodeoxychorismate synthase component I, partial [Blastocatellia bacterium]|nr:aminodeoxychorismate synthase component I [Blastocatellia bacterium]